VAGGGLKALSHLEQFPKLWNILGTKPSVLGVFFSAFHLADPQLAAGEDIDSDSVGISFIRYNETYMPNWMSYSMFFTRIP
jgi:hypothetical protein